MRLNIPIVHKTALTICRIEPENNLEMLIKGALLSDLERYTIVGNWNFSPFGKQLRSKYKSHTKLNLLDPIYDAREVAKLRESSEIYLHGHSVGGTNPSLVEMIFYDAKILCFDISYNKHTAQSSALYFRNYNELSLLINKCLCKSFPTDKRLSLRKSYTRNVISKCYVDAYENCSNW